MVSPINSAGCPNQDVRGSFDPLESTTFDWFSAGKLFDLAERRYKPPPSVSSLSNVFLVHMQDPAPDRAMAYKSDTW